MRIINFNEMVEFTKNYSEAMKKFKSEPIMAFDYMGRVLDQHYQEVNGDSLYPMKIKIPKETKYLLKGDFEPAQVITVEKPIMWEGHPIWFGSSNERVYLRFGYKNLDVRHISDIELSMETIHGFLGGSSGQGKSVTINAILFALFMEYGPWELEVNLSDAKIVEFKKYGVNHRIPHIASIAATSDADFVISVLQKAFDEMQMRNKIFGNLGVSNLKSFRKKTGLALPRVVVVMDEVESTFKFAGKKATKIADLIDGFARLGRSAGYHIIMATQNLTADIPSSAIGQIKLRMCLGATETVSEKILGNKGAAANMGRIGRLIANLDTLNGGNTVNSNIKFQTPYLTDDNFEFEMAFLENKGKEVGYRSKMAFYDEEDIKTMPEMKNIIKRVQGNMEARGELTKTEFPLILGFPSFVTTDKDELLKINLTSEDIENIAVTSPLVNNIKALLSILSSNFIGYYKMFHVTSKDEYKDCFPDNTSTFAAKATQNKNFSFIYFLVYQALMYDTIDEIAKNMKVMQPQQVSKAKEYYNTVQKPQYCSNEYMLKRYIAFKNLSSYPDYADVYENTKNYFVNFDRLVEVYETKKVLDRWFVKKDYERKALFLGDINKIVGLGRDSKTKELTKLKKLLQDCSKVNIVTIVYATTFQDCSELTSGFRYMLYDSIDEREYNKLKVDSAGELSASLCLLNDNYATEKQHKFKRTKLI